MARGSLAAGLIVSLILVGCRGAPVIEKVTPEKGPEAGGTTLTVTGRRFRKDAQITLDGTPLRETIVLDSRTLRVALPPHDPSIVTIGVLNPPDDRSKRLARFEYLDTTPARLISMEPVGAVPAEPSVRVVRAIYSEPLTEGEMSVSDESGARIEGTSSIDGEVLTFRAREALSPGHTYTALLRGVADRRGNVAEPDRFRFTIAEP